MLSFSFRWLYDAPSLCVSVSDVSEERSEFINNGQALQVEPDLLDCVAVEDESITFIRNVGTLTLIQCLILKHSLSLFLLFCLHFLTFFVLSSVHLLSLLCCIFFLFSFLFVFLP